MFSTLNKTSSIILLGMLIFQVALSFPVNEVLRALCLDGHHGSVSNTDKEQDQQKKKQKSSDVPIFCCHDEQNIPQSIVSAFDNGVRLLLAFSSQQKADLPLNPPMVKVESLPG